MSYRAELMKALIDRKADNRAMLEYTRKMAGHTEDEKEEMARRFLDEIQERYALQPWEEYIRGINEKNDIAELKRTYNIIYLKNRYLSQAAARFLSLVDERERTRER